LARDTVYICAHWLLNANCSEKATDFKFNVNMKLHAFLHGQSGHDA